MNLPDVPLLAPESSHEGANGDAAYAVNGNARLQYSLDSAQVAKRSIFSLKIQLIFKHIIITGCRPPPPFL